MRRLRVTCLLLFISGAPLAGAQQPAAASESARADLALLRRADAARTRGVAPGGAIDTARATIHEFVDHACPSCRAFVRSRGDSLARLATAERANLVFRVSPIPGLLRGAHAAEGAFCAGALGGAAAFDRVHAQLLDEQESWRHRRDVLPFLMGVAAAASLDTVQFARCVRTGAMRPLVLSDARLAGQFAVDGTPTLIVTRGNALGNSVRVVGEGAMPRVQQALVSAAAAPADETTAYVLVGRWRLDSVDVFRWDRDSAAASTRALEAARASVARTLAELRAGRLRIETVFEPTLRYTHTLRSGDQTTYSETGAWAVPGLTGRMHVMTEAGADGTYHLSRIIARTGTRLVLERHYTSGNARGTAERVFLTLQPSTAPAEPGSPEPLPATRR